ncbi:MAG: hypothetical protein RIQ89_1987 [Bacteroidota bacterium]
MANKYKEYQQLNLPQLADEILQWWQKEQVFEASITEREAAPPFVFYEGPPSANGLPGIHHVMARAIKDIFCRYKTLKGFKVERKGGWDTHGLPIELSVEKTLGITKEDIGKKISIADYNKACRKEVMKYKEVWDDLTRKMGYWVDLENPYITFENYYIESCWYLLGQLYQKNLLYKGYTIQPYSPAAGTGLSSHELNQPGTYKEVKDTTIVAQFAVDATKSAAHPIIQNEKFWPTNHPLYLLAWTTTPWTLPSNTGLAVGKNIDYAFVQTFNQYSHQPVVVIIAQALIGKYFNPKNEALALEDYQSDGKNIPYRIIGTAKGHQLAGIYYHQLLPYATPQDGDSFKVVVGDFVSTEDGTGIVHLAPSFGADDFRTAQQHQLGNLTLVNKQGKFTDEVKDPVFGFAGEPVKEQYLTDSQKAAALTQQQLTLKSIIPKLDKYLSVDERIALKLKIEGKAFKIEKYDHNYPHCWRTDKPILYYPLDSWFIRTTAAKDKMIALNKTINWKPESTGTGRFGNWLENLVDWNLSRSRYWGIPLPIWRTQDSAHEKCIGSLAQLHAEIEKAIAAGLMSANPYPSSIDANNKDSFDLHRPFIDDVILVADNGMPMYREADLIDVWFDSGAMPYAQHHFVGQHQAPFGKGLGCADFIAEGVDQTRGWFFTLHAIASMLFDSVAFKNVVSNGLVLDKNGNKMSKRLGNAVDPFDTLAKYGPDATRWYMIANAQPWDNLKFNLEGIGDVQRKFFGTLHNTYAFFALYANIDGFNFKENPVPLASRPELDRWILSELNTLIHTVDLALADYEPTKAARAIGTFVSDYLSNWYVRLCRRRFWKGEYSTDKIAAYQTLYTCLEVVAQLMSPIAPFFAERLFTDLNNVTNRQTVKSVHHSYFPIYDESAVDKALEQRMELAQQISSMVLSLRKKVNIKVRQPLQKILLPVTDHDTMQHIQAVKELIMAEVNVKELQFLTADSGLIKKKIKPNFKSLGKKVGPLMKDIAAAINAFDQNQINAIEQQGTLSITMGEQTIAITTEDVEIHSEEVPGWQVVSEAGLTVALDTTISPALREEGLAREFINRIQNLRKEKGFEVTDKINLKILSSPAIETSLVNNKDYICAEILANSFEFVQKLPSSNMVAAIEVEENLVTQVEITKN